MSSPNRIIKRWILGGALGALFVWMATHDWPWSLIFGAPLHLRGIHLLGGQLGGVTPEAIISGATSLPENAWHLNLLGIVPYLCTLVAIHFLRVVRWMPLLKAMGRQVPFRVLNITGGVSFAAIFLFPLRLGEFVRPVLLSRLSDVRVSEAMALVILERIFDGLAVTLILAMVLLWMPMENPEAYFRIQTGATLALAVFSVGLGGIVLSYFFRARVGAICASLFRGNWAHIGQKVEAVLRRFYGGLACLPNLRVMLGFSGVTAVYWLLNGWGHYTMVRAFGFDLDPVVGFAMMASVAIGMMIPNSPANIGIFWYFLLLPLEIYGFSTHSVQAVVFALFLWGTQMAQMALFGLFFLSRAPVTFRDVAYAVPAENDAMGSVSEERELASQRGIS